MSEKGYDCALVDYSDGYMAKHCPANVSLYPYEKPEEYTLPNDAVLIFQAMTPWTIFERVKYRPAHRVFFWGCHPYNFVPSVPFVGEYLLRSRKVNRLFLKTVLRKYWQQTKTFIELLESRAALSYMDAPNLRSTEFFYGRRENVSYLPIPAAGAQDGFSGIDNEDVAVLRLTWVGRLVDFKYHILTYSLRELDKLGGKLDYELRVVVIGDGPYRQTLEQDVTSFKHLQVEFINEISPDGLDHYLAENTDLMLAMGTSALEAAKLAIPTLLLDFSYSKVVGGYRFKLLYDHDNYSLGEDITGQYSRSTRFSAEVNDNLKEIISSVRSNKNTVGAKCFEYFNRYHSLAVVSDVFVSKISQSSCLFSDIEEKGLTKPGFLYVVKKKLGN